jgi:apolipoprotein N-acyltransferase
MTLSATAYSLPFRVVVSVLATMSRTAVLGLAVLAFFSPEPISSARLLRAFWLLVLAPEAGVWILRYLLGASVSIDDGAIVLQLRARRVDIPLSAVDGVTPWTLPIPAPGLWLRLRSGTRLSDGLSMADSGAFLKALRDAGASELADRVARHPTLLYAQSKYLARSCVDHPFFKYVLFALVPTVPLFRLRQILTYGGTFGEYYDFGLKTYLLGFGIHWVLYGVYLLMYAALLRTASEVVALGAAWLAPSRESRVRRACEIVQRVLYFGGVPTFLILRFIPW